MHHSRARLAAVFTWLCLAWPAEAAQPLRVFAASSLKEAFEQIAADFERANPGQEIELSFAGSQVLRTQIEQGASADLFASADAVHSDALRAARLLGETHVFARNALAVVTPKEGARVRQLSDLATKGVKVVVAAPTVPAGRYAAEVLRKLAASGAYGRDFDARVRANVVSEETNVRAALAKVSLGEADAAFVYATDALSAEKTVRAIAIPDAGNIVAEYLAGVVAGSRNEAAGRFVEFLRSDDARRVLTRQGFH